MMGRTLFLLALALARTNAAPVPSTTSAKVCTTASPCITLNNGVQMPQISLGTWQYNDTVAADAIKKGMAAGFTHIDTAENYENQVGVGKALSGLPRDSFFLTTKTTPCAEATEAACEAQATKEFLGDLKDLNLEYVDLILLHGASHRGAGKCEAASCTKDLGQWKAYEKLYKMGKAKAIGVSNYCVSCFECLVGAPGVTVVPAVNQIQYHVGMGSDPAGIISYCKKNNILVQAYSPLGNGALISDPALKTIGAKLSPAKSSAQVALKWVAQQGYAVCTKADNPAYLAEDIDIVSWNMTATDMASLSAATSPAGKPSWACTA